MVDLIILSNGKNGSLRQMTQRCIDSINDERCRIIVIEQTKFKYKNCQTIHKPEQFNYNAFANYGAKMGSNEWIMIANNDLIFNSGWLDALMDYPVVEVMSPKCLNDKRQRMVLNNAYGYEVGKHLAGWCFMINRKTWEQIGGFDEDFAFWCADNSLVEQLKAIGVKPIVKPKAIITHLGSTTLATSTNRYELTRLQVLKFNKKYNQNLFGLGKE